MITFKSTILVAAMTLAANVAQAATFGYFSNNSSSVTGAQTAVTAASQSFVSLGGLSAADLTGIDVLWVTNANNNSQLAQIAPNFAAIESFVTGGGVFVYNDREVTNAANSLMGGAGFVFQRDLGPDVDVINGSTALTFGAGGVIDDTTLDGGSQSTHGFAVAASLPATATGILSHGPQSNEFVDFTYSYGQGYVHYSTIPVDFYLQGGTSAFAQTYAANLASYAADLSENSVAPVPLPASGFLLLGSLGAVFARAGRRKAKPAA